MFLRCHSRKKNGKPHRYWSVVESRRLDGGSRHSGRCCIWAKSTTARKRRGGRRSRVFDEARRQTVRLALFPDDRPVPMDRPRRWRWYVDQICSCFGRVRSATAGWAVCCGGSWAWMFSGRASWAMSRRGPVGEGAATAGGQSPVRSRQRVCRSSPLVPHSAMDELLGWILPWRRRTGCTAAWIAC